VSLPSPSEEAWTVEEDESLVDEPSFDEMEPQNKKHCSRGRPPNSDEPCEHGPSVKSCQKCVYRHRIQKVRNCPFDCCPSL